jgi:hypothetical protein
MASEEHVEQPARPMAWGQLVAGSVVGGLALWSIALDVFGVTPSALLAGIAAAYQGWRDWLLAPLLGQFAIALSPVNRDVLAFDAVMLAAWVRTAVRFPEAWGELFDVFLWPSLGTLAIFYAAPDLWSPSFGVAAWISIAAGICAIDLFIRPFAGIAATLFVDEHTAAHLASLNTPAARFGFWNALAVVAFAGGLFVVDWAMV